MRRLLYLSDQNFLYWGADGNLGDVFTAYTITLESDFPDDAVVIVNRSLRNTDKFVGQLRPMIDGSPESGDEVGNNVKRPRDRSRGLAL